MINLQPTIPLQPGDAVATVAPSSALNDDQRLREGLSILESWGLLALEQAVADRRWGYLAGRDDQRFSDLTQTAPPRAQASRGAVWVRSLNRSSSRPAR